MKRLEKKSIETLLSIIGTTPEFQIVQFADSGETFIDMLDEYCQKQNYFYQINCLDDTLFSTLKEKFKERDKRAVMKIPLDRRSYRIQAREYQFMFVTVDIEEEMRGDFLEKSHVIIRSAGNIVIFIKKKDYKERDSWTALLEEKLYVSTSVLDDIFENYDVIVSKRMHGWGN